MQPLARRFAAKPRRAARRHRLSKRALREELSFHLFTLPWLLGFIFLTATPLIFGFAISLTNYDGFNWGAWKFLGLKNYSRALADADVLGAMRNSARYSVIVVPVGLALSFLLAVMLNRPISGQGLFRTLYYIPSILPVTGSVWAWSLMAGKHAGLINAFLSFFRPGTAINWMSEQYFLMLYLHAWWRMGGGVVIFLAGLQGVATELYEAARLDGANRFQVFFGVTLPLMTPVIFFQLIVGIIDSLQIMAVPILFARATPSGSESTTAYVGRERYLYMVYQYIQIFDFQRYGYGVALCWIFFLLALVLTAIVLLSSRYWVFYEVAQEGEAK